MMERKLGEQVLLILIGVAVTLMEEALPVDVSVGICNDFMDE